jgi:hypothetical protein
MVFKVAEAQQVVSKSDSLPELNHCSSAIQASRSGLQSLSTNPVSPYSSLEPITSGDYNQRILNAINAKRPFFLRYWAPSSVRYSQSVFKMTSLLVGSVFATIYFTNAIVVYEKEQKVLKLLEERRELKSRIDLAIS